MNNTNYLEYGTANNNFTLSRARLWHQENMRYQMANVSFASAPIHQKMSKLISPMSKQPISKQDPIEPIKTPLDILGPQDFLGPLRAPKDP